MDKNSAINAENEFEAKIAYRDFIDKCSWTCSYVSFNCSCFVDICFFWYAYYAILILLIKQLFSAVIYHNYHNCISQIIFELRLTIGSKFFEKLSTIIQNRWIDLLPEDRLRTSQCLSYFDFFGWSILNIIIF